jgi:hypothetical protein
MSNQSIRRPSGVVSKSWKEEEKKRIYLIQIIINIFYYRLVGGQYICLRENLAIERREAGVKKSEDEKRYY